MPSVNSTINVSGGGITIQQSALRTTDGQDGREIALAAGKAGTLTTRTDANTGVVTVGSGHGITTANTVDLYWAGGLRYGVTVTGTTSTTISLDVGAGDDLPSTSTAIVICVQTTVNITIDGDNLALAAFNQKYAGNSVTSKSHVDFQDDGPATVAEFDLNANTPQTYDVAGGSTNPFSGGVVLTALVSNGSSTTAATFQLIVSQDTTP